MNYFDLVVASFILILGFKGLLNGLIKEVFGIIGIIGGVYIASRNSIQMGEFINSTIYQFSNSAMMSLVGFLSVLVLFWGFVVLAGNIVSKLSDISGLGIFDKIFGFAFGAGKVFLILSVVVYAISSVEFLKKSISKYTEESFFYDTLVEAGKVIIKIDPQSLLPRDKNSSI